MLNDLDETHLFVTAEIIAPLQVFFVCLQLPNNSLAFFDQTIFDLLIQYHLYMFQEKIDDLMDKMNVPVVDGKSGSDK